MAVDDRAEHLRENFCSPALREAPLRRSGSTSGAVHLAEPSFTSLRIPRKARAHPRGVRARGSAAARSSKRRHRAIFEMLVKSSPPLQISMTMYR